MAPLTAKRVNARRWLRSIRCTISSAFGMLKWLKGKIAAKAPSVLVADADQLSLQPAPPTAKTQGDENLKAGRYGDAERCYRQVRETDPTYPDSLVLLGFVLRQQGRTDEARKVLERAVQIASDDADSHYLLASILEATGPRDAEISHLQKAIQLRPNFELARCQLVIVLFNSGQYAEAMTLAEDSIAILPQCAELHFYLSTLYLQAEQRTKAIESCRRALALSPTLIPAQQSLSRLLFESAKFAEAEVSFRREIEITPEHFGPHHQLGVMLTQLGRHAEAIELFKRAILLNPHSGASYSSLGAAYINFDQASGETLALAHASYEQAIAVEPDNSELHYNLGTSHQSLAQIDRAMESFDRAIQLDSNNVRARWAKAMLWAPAYSSKGTHDSPDRSGFSGELTAFYDWWVKSDIDGAAFVGEIQPFFLTYQEEGNLALLRQYGEVCAIAMRRWLERQPSPAFRRPVDKRIRVGIVSADIRLHSVWKALIKGWFLSLDRECFELVVFSLSDRTDSETSWARERSDVFIGGPKTLFEWVEAVREQNCAILIYPAVGLHPMVTKLASLRLASVQINAWGHPDTSGLPTLDYYLSAECFEPAAAQTHYSEQLLLLPNLGNRLEPMTLSLSDPGFAALDIDLERPILVCPGTPFKYQPVHDHIFVNIVRLVPNAQLVFFRPSAGALADVLQLRIIEVFRRAGLDAKHSVRFIRWLDSGEFHFLLGQADVMLDTIGFSGYNTAVQAIACGVPLVTREGEFLRGRLASGVLRRMHLEELIVQTKAQYVQLVGRIVTDRGYRDYIQHEIRCRRSVLFDDQYAMGPFQDFLRSVANASLNHKVVERAANHGT